MSNQKSYSPAGSRGITTLDFEVPLIAVAGGQLVTDLNFETIVRGNYYSAGHLFQAVANNASAQLLLTVPATAKSDIPPGAEFGAIGYQIIVKGDSRVTYTRGVTTTADGTSLPIVNHNDNSPNTSKFSLFHTPTAPTGGTVLINNLPIFAGGEEGGPGGIQEDIGLRVLAPGTKYLMNVENRSGVASDIWIGGVGIEFNFISQ